MAFVYLKIPTVFSTVAFVYLKIPTVFSTVVFTYLEIPTEIILCFQKEPPVGGVFSARPLPKAPHIVKYLTIIPAPHSPGPRRAHPITKPSRPLSGTPHLQPDRRFTYSPPALDFSIGAGGRPEGKISLKIYQKLSSTPPQLHKKVI